MTKMPYPEGYGTDVFEEGISEGEVVHLGAG
jgi:hypothetical protein